MQLQITFLTTLIQELHGQIAIPLKKSEIKQTAAHAGLSVLLKPWVIEFALLAIKLDKIESQLKLLHLAALLADWDAMEDNPQWLGTGIDTVD